jgi:SAM-dependent methyltransferase
MLSRNQIKSFYERVDRVTTYTVETDPDKHPFSPLLKDFIDKWTLANKKLLEIGSSKGLFQDFVADYTGVDVAECLRPHYRKPYVIVKDARLPFVDGHFDAIFTYATHEHIPDIETALEEIIRVLKPGGGCLFAPAWHTRPWFAQGYALRPYSELSTREKLVKCSIRVRDFFLLRWTFVLLRRIFRLLLYTGSLHSVPLRYRKLKANYNKFWQSDSDACNSLDPFDVILWFRSRGCSASDSKAS